ncbi:TIGR04104 family putative zinc finger protein [Halobacillus ihumii]|uniref:TIGR04104 family putative zinc finger protein n=1 Tax=Halobacillus ihumii TaxID=2686092 RepID=UPI0013D6AD97|nr:TIGR04104 family putative zinc finger protein [Halobacillus ihumii]
MPNCQNCGRNWSWRQTFKRSLSFRISMDCPHCKEKQYITSKVRKRSSLIPFLTAPIIMLSVYLDFSTVASFSILAGMLILLIVFYPFMIELSNEEEPIW